MLAAVATSFVVGGIICILVSLCSGVLTRIRILRSEEEEFESCRALDNPAKPWSLQYAVDSANRAFYTVIPTYHQVYFLPFRHSVTERMGV